MAESTFKVDGGIESTGIITATTFAKSGGTSSQFLKADGSVDARTFSTSDTTYSISAADHNASSKLIRLNDGSTNKDVILTGGNNITLSRTGDEISIEGGSTTTNLGVVAGAGLTITSSTGTDATVPAATASAWGAMTSTDKSKLDAVESNATADQTASEIQTLYEALSDVNRFTDALKNKLDGIAASAEVNVQSDWNAASGDARILNKPTIPTNNNQLSNGAGYLTAESDTLASVTTRGNTTTNDINVRNITGVGATFTGVLTFEDVTNIDSVGLVTARAGIHANDDVTFLGTSGQYLEWDKSQSALEFQDGARANFGTGNDLQISHTNVLSGQNDSNGDSVLAGTDWCSYIHEVGTGPLIFKSDGGPSSGAYQFYDTSWRPVLKLFSGTNARASLYHAGTEKLATTEHGIDVTGHVETDTLNVSGLSTFVGNIDASGVTVTGGTVNDTAGNVRELVNNIKTAAYTLTANDVGELINITTGGVTVPSSIFSAGQAITIYNSSNNNQTITQAAGVVMYLVGTNTSGNRTLAQRGVATVLCTGTNNFVIMGGGLS